MIGTGSGGLDYKIGEFSKINKISQRMLRYYDEKGLLTSKKDEANEYRFYSADDICANIIFPQRTSNVCWNRMKKWSSLFSTEDRRTWGMRMRLKK
ncbi:MerR family DNA-binding transcriptional regulator [Paenibacillus tyrfis]|uniref:MerR family DNA-binding transcriptional regulator n=1 Tax=Paenibacillus tyrfis TaxID=1501230 RepID=UPI000B5922B9|nr:MerR family DNA-binding transcriptional regulator [Paenibacillus tyrfis]